MYMFQEDPVAEYTTTINTKRIKSMQSYHLPEKFVKYSHFSITTNSPGFILQSAKQ